MYFLSADFGTSSVKIAIMDGTLRVVKIATKSYNYIVRDTDKVEIAVEDLFKAFTSALAELSPFLGDVEMLCFDTFAPSLVLMDKTGNALYPIVTHLDRRSRDCSRYIVRTIGVESFQSITGTLPHAGGVTATSILWFRMHESAIFNQTCKFGHLNTFLYKFFTGKWAIDRVNASITGLYETIAQGGWSPGLCDDLGIPVGKLPDICELGSEQGRLSAKAAKYTGLKAGIPVLLGTQDVAAAQIGAGNRRNGDILCISGSSEMISVLSESPRINQKYYVRASAAKGLWQIFSISIGGFALEWFRNQFFDTMSSQEFYDFMLNDVVKKFDAKTVKFHPYLAGDRQSLVKKRGSFTGLTLETNKTHMLCAILEGIQRPSMEMLALCEGFMKPNRKVKATGNLAEQACYLEFKARIFKNYSFAVIDHCPLKGNILIAREMSANAY